MSIIPRTLSSSSLLSEGDDVVEGYSIYSVSESLDDSLGSDCPVLSPRGGGDPARPFEVRVEELLRNRARGSVVVEKLPRRASGGCEGLRREEARLRRREARFRPSDAGPGIP